MENVQLHAHLEIRWSDARPAIVVKLDEQGTLVSILHAPDEGLRARMLAIARPLIAALERLPEQQPRMGDLPDDSPF